MKFNLQAKILFAVTLIVTVIVAGLAFSVISSQRQFIYSSRKSSALNLTQALDARITTREKLSDSEKLQSEIEQVMKMNPSLVQMNISLPRRNELRVVASSNDDLTGSEAIPEALSVFEKGETYVESYTDQDGEKIMQVIAPFHVGNQRMGVYHLKFSLQDLEGVVQKTQRRFFYGILAAVPILLIALLLLLRRTLLNPLRRLQQGAQAIGSGNFEYRIRLDRRDEIGNLAESFNKMAEQISDFYKKLDEKVEERTRQLEETKQKLKKKFAETRKAKRELESSKEKLENAQQRLKEKVRDRTDKLRELAEKREEIIRRRTQRLRNSRKALMNILEDMEQAKNEAENERDKTLAIINNLADGLLVFDQNNNLTLINPQAREFFDVKKKLTGEPVEKLVDSSLEPLIELLGEEIKEVSREELKLEPDLILEVTSVPMIREEKAGETLVILHDITREKRVERMKTEFVSIAAHQLRTPLSEIKWTLNTLLEEELGELTEEQEEYIRETYDSNERMIGLIKDLLNVTRIEEGKYVYEPEVTSLENLAREVLGKLSSRIDKKDINLVFDEPTQPTSIKVDVEKVKLALKNLIDNAIRYSPDQGRIVVTIKQKEKVVQCSVKDNGIGIPEKQQDRIFNKFFRASNATRKQTEGSGLGLFITKNIIEAHGGQIWFKSEPGKATTFWFTLPNKEEFEEEQ